MILNLVFICFSCNKTKKEAVESVNPQDTVYSVMADAETQPVSSALNEDAADDPSVWFNQADPEKSTIIGTNKKMGLAVYDFKGDELFFYPIGNVNNVDVRYGFDLNGAKVDLVAASNRSANGISLFKVVPETGALEDVSAGGMVSEVDEVYGLCMYCNRISDKYYVFVNGKSGAIEQWELHATEGGKIDGEIVRRISVATQPEGMVADDIQNILYVGEEDAGVWKFGASADAGYNKTLIPFTDTLNKNISFDIEGISLYYSGETAGYLIVSSQGNHTYAVYERRGSNAYLGSFAIGDGILDGAEETDGLDVINLPVGDRFPNGVLVVQDGYNFEGDTVSTQNFKMVDWAKIANAFSAKLSVDTAYCSFCK